MTQDSSPARRRALIVEDEFLIALDLEGIAVSTGSACPSGTLEPSHVLKAMGLPFHRAQSSLRFALLVFTMIATAVIVTVLMFRTLYIVLG